MITCYYKMKYRDFQKHASRIPSGHWHSTDETLTDDSEIVLKLVAPDHVHQHLNEQGLMEIDPNVVRFETQHLRTAHPFLRHRGL